MHMHMQTCLYVYTCVHMHVRACAHTCSHTCVQTHPHLHMELCDCAQTPPAARVHTNVHRCVHKCACKPTSACTPVHARACTYTPAQACSQPTGTRGHPTPGGRSLGSCLPCLHLCPAEPPQLVTAMINVHCSVSPTPAPSGATPDTVSPPTPVTPTVWGYLDPAEPVAKSCRVSASLGGVSWTRRWGCRDTLGGCP